MFLLKYVALSAMLLSLCFGPFLWYPLNCSIKHVSQRSGRDRVDSSSMEKKGITSLNDIQKVKERILDGRLRRIVECEMEKEQQGFRKGRGSADVIFTGGT